MKKVISTKVISIILIICLIFGGVTFGKMKCVNAAENTLTVKASDFNNGTSKISDKNNPTVFNVREYLNYDEVKLVLDDDIHLSSLTCYANLNISGSGKLCIDRSIKDDDGKVTVYGDLTIEKSTKVYFDSSQPAIHVWQYNNEGGHFTCYGDIEGKYLYRIIADNSAAFYGSNVKLDACTLLFTGAGSVKINDSKIDIPKASRSLINSGSNVEIKNTSIKCDCVEDTIVYSNGNVSIENCDITAETSSQGIFANGGKLSVSGNLKINAEYSALYSVGHITISGGSMELSGATQPVIIANQDFTFNGDYLKASTPSEFYALYAGGDISFGENNYIKSPKNGKIDRYESVNTIIDTDGNPAKIIEISKYGDLKNAVISGVEDKVYTGQPITQKPVLKLDGVTLTEGEDYTLSYSDNIAVGTAKITFKAVDGSGYAGETSVTFNITKADDDGGDDDKGDDKGDDKDSDQGGKQDSKKYSSEWVNGKWYNADGTQTYKAVLSWKQNATGWWVEDTSGWYAKNEWQKIDGKWYFFTADGYMDYSEYRDGCWLGADGTWDEAYSGGHWASDSTGWWYTDASGWYPQNQWVWIDGSCYYFGEDGYMLTNQYVDGCWVGADGAWVK